MPPIDGRLSFKPATTDRRFSSEAVGGSRVAGKYRKGVLIGKADEYIEISNILEPARTIEFWFKPNWDGSDAETYRIFDASTAAIFFCIGKGAQIGEREDELTFCFENAADTDIFMSVSAKGVIKVGEWHHIAATWDFDASEAMFYVNGEEVASAKDVGDFPPLNTKPRPRKALLCSHVICSYHTSVIKIQSGLSDQHQGKVFSLHHLSPPELLRFFLRC